MKSVEQESAAPPKPRHGNVRILALLVGIIGGRILAQEVGIWPTVIFGIIVLLAAIGYELHR